MTERDISLFKPDENCWRIETANHAAMVIDAENFYRDLYQVICKAKHSIFILGWDIDSRIPLIRGMDVNEGDEPVTLFTLLTRKAQENPDLQIYLNQWDHTFLMAADREFMAAVRWRSANCPNIHFRFDSVVPIHGSQHQKIVVIDDEIAFSGGLDVGVARWDTRAHSADEPLRVDFPSNDKNKKDEQYIPNHDIQILVSGPMAQALAELARRRWLMATDFEAIPMRINDSDGLPETWPENTPPQFTNIMGAVSLTFPPIGDNPPLSHIENIYMDEIAAAEKFIYIENQYLASDKIAAALNRRLKERPALRVLVFSSKDPAGVVEELTMWVKRISFKRILYRGVKDRTAMVYGITKSSNKVCSVHVHSKIMIVDDKFLHVGSANLNERSMKLDTECDIILVGQNQNDCAKIADIRNDLIREHSGMEIKDVQALVDNGNTINDFLKDVSGSTQNLRRIRDTISTKAIVLHTIMGMGARKRPIVKAVTNYFSNHDDVVGFPHKRISGAFLVIMLALLMLLFWNSTPVAQIVTAEGMRAEMDLLKNSPYAIPAVLLIFVVGGFLFIPVTFMIAATAAVFGSLMGLGLALAGAMLSAISTFMVGFFLGEKIFQNFANTAFLRVSDKLKDTGVIGLAALRMLPLAPYTLVNMILGASTIQFIPFVAGTFLGILPGTVAMVIVGDSLGQIWRSPNAENLIYIGVGILIWLAVLIGIHRWVGRVKDDRGKEYV